MNATVELIATADGSHTVIDQLFKVPYHSRLGALQESQRVFIELGLQYSFEHFPNQDLNLFEMGLGTGLNALLTAYEAESNQSLVYYTAIDAYPLPTEATRQLNYDTLLGTKYLNAMHGALWGTPAAINPFFTLTKVAVPLLNFDTDGRFHVIYYDAFAPSAQPELWEPPIFEKLAHLLQPGGVLTTYCSKSYVQRNLRAAGLVVEKHPGPARKREVLRAVKP